MLLSEIHHVNQLILELIRSGWRKSVDQNPLKDDLQAPYFRAVNIDTVVGNTFDFDYLRRVDIYPQGENLTSEIGLSALISSKGEIIRWEIFRHYLGTIPVSISLSRLELTPKSLRTFLESHQ